MHVCVEQNCASVAWLYEPGPSTPWATGAAVVTVLVTTEPDPQPATITAATHAAMQAKRVRLTAGPSRSLKDMMLSHRPWDRGGSRLLDEVPRPRFVKPTGSQHPGTPRLGLP
jgi:hypothetical protein